MLNFRTFSHSRDLSDDRYQVSSYDLSESSETNIAFAGIIPEGPQEGRVLTLSYSGEFAYDGDIVTGTISGLTLAIDGRAHFKIQPTDPIAVEGFEELLDNISDMLEGKDADPEDDEDDEDDGDGDADGVVLAKLGDMDVIEDLMESLWSDGSDFDGNDRDDEVVGRDGDDHMSGGGGDDDLDGGLGDDLLSGGKGRDRLHGGRGEDEMDGGSGADDLRGGSGNDRMSGGQGRDTLLGGRGQDDMRGGRGVDDMRGGNGRDRLSGGSEDDDLNGGFGNDRLHGGDGDDDIVGGRGTDIMTGGDGEDSFIFRDVRESETDGDRDTIRDFVSGEDDIDLVRIDARVDRDGNQKFRFIEDDDFSGRSGELREDDGVIYGDVDGDGVADFGIQVFGDTVGVSDLLL